MVFVIDEKFTNGISFISSIEIYDDEYSVDINELKNNAPTSSFPAYIEDYVRHIIIAKDIKELKEKILKKLLLKFKLEEIFYIIKTQYPKLFKDFIENYPEEII